MGGLYSSILEHAIRTASEFHRKQTRKGTELPYISHPAGVMLILQRAGFDDDRLLAAAILHDVVEDTDCTIEMLAGQFPPEVVGWVAETSEQKQDDDGTTRSWIDRKREHLEHASAASPEARAIILADKFHNLFSILYDLEQGAAVWDRFNAPPEHLLWYNSAMIEAISTGVPRLAALQESANYVLQTLIEKTGIHPSIPA